jgi:hypothetical protein
MWSAGEQGQAFRSLLTKARILLKADVSDAGEGWSDSMIAGALDTSIATVERIRRQLVEEGFEAVLTRKYNPKSARPQEGEEFVAPEAVNASVAKILVCWTRCC